jgi:hypothetical protein
MTADLLRRHKQMRLLVAGLGVLFVVTAVLVASWVLHTERRAGASRPNESAAAPAQPTPPAQTPLPAQTPPAQAVASYAAASTSQPQPSQAAVPNGNNSAVRPPTGSIDAQEVQRALNTMVQHADRGDSSPSAASTASSASSGSDRYPNSQPVEVKDVSIPDIGVPVASEVYTTTDSVATVVDYYRQRYPEAEMTEVNGQKIVAVNQPGATKVIAIGSTGSETRIAIVQPAD